MLKRLSFAERWVGLVFWCLLLLIVAYGRALWLPFFFDDYVHLPFVDEHSLLSMWQTAGDLAYFRPLPFSIWKVMFLVVGEHNAVLHRLLNFALHGSSGLMVAWLASARTVAVPEKWVRRYFAAACFILFPFSYQAVPWNGALAQLLVTFLVLLACVSYGKGRQTGSRAWYMLSLAATLLAPFAHESGAMIGPLIGVYELTVNREQWSLKQWLLRVAVWTLPALLWLPVRLLVPGGPSSTISPGNLETFVQNSFYFGQGWAYPLTWWGGWLRDTLAWNDLTVIALLSLTALVPALLWPLKRGDHQATIFAIAWFGLTSLPAILFLRFDYVINGPRLLMLASVGIVLFWTQVVLAALHPGNGLRFSRVVLVVVLVLMVWGQNLLFIRERMVMHQLLGDLYVQVGEVTAANDAAATHTIVINLPSWLAAERAVYALGHEGVLFWPNYAFPELLVQLQTGRAAAFVPVRVDAIRTNMAYFHGIAGRPPEWNELAQQPGRFYQVVYGDEQLRLQPVGAFVTAAAAAPPLASFTAGDVTLILTEVKAYQVDNQVDVMMAWQASGAVTENVTVFVHLLNQAGQLIGQADGDFLAGTLPLTVWPPQQPLVDQREGVVEGAAAFVAVGLYRRDDGQRLPAVDSDGTPWPDNAVVIPVNVAIP